LYTLVGSAYDDCIRAGVRLELGTSDRHCPDESGLAACQLSTRIAAGLQSISCAAIRFKSRSALGDAVTASEILLDVFKSLQQSGLLTIAVLVFSISGGLFAFIYGLSAKRSERALRIIEKQIGQFDGEMTNWGIRGIDALSIAYVYVLTNFSGRDFQQAKVAKDELQATLSALVDVGRLYFVNRSPDLEGVERPYANRGFRPAILDALMLAHEELRRLELPHHGETDRIVKSLFGARRVFVSELREEIDKFRDPAVLNTLRTLDDDWTEMEKLVDDFEGRYGARAFWQRRPMARARLIAEKQQTTNKTTTKAA
jgi:hypothetical protein